MYRRRTPSRAPPFKRRRTGASRGYARRLVGPRGNKHLLVRSVIPRSFTGGDSIIRKFRRLGEDCTILGLGLGTVGAVYQNTGSPPSWIDIGTPSSDTPFAPNLIQFGVATVWRFNQIIDASQLGNLFNEYQLHKVELHFSMDNAPAYSQGDGNNPNAIPSVYLRYDPNDNVTPLASLPVMNGGDTQYRSLRNPFVFSFYPRPAQVMFASSQPDGYGFPSNNRSMWLDTSPPSNSIEHYGVKMWFRNFNSANQVGLGVRIQPVFYFSCRRVR